MFLNFPVALLDLFRTALFGFPLELFRLFAATCTHLPSPPFPDKILFTSMGETILLAYDQNHMRRIFL
jgi:hypothetical protein